MLGIRDLDPSLHPDPLILTYIHLVIILFLLKLIIQTKNQLLCDRGAKNVLIQFFNFDTRWRF